MSNFDRETGAAEGPVAAESKVVRFQSRSDRRKSLADRPPSSQVATIALLGRSRSPSEPLPAPALQFPPRGGAARLASQPFVLMLAPPRLNRPCLAVRAFVNAVAPALRTTSPLALRSSHAPVPFPSACRPRGTTPPSSRWGCRRSCSAAVVFVAAVVGSGLGGGASGGLAAAAAAT